MPILMKRPDEKLVVDATEAQQKLFSRAHSKSSTSDYLAPLYEGTPFNSLRNRAVPATTATCSCTLTLDSDIRDLKPLVYLTGVVTGDVQVGDWLVFAVDGKISGMSPVYRRADKLRIMTLVKSEDFSSPSTAVVVYRVSAGGTALQKVTTK